jgi:hypothetical protein
MHERSNIGAYIKAVASILPVASAAATVNGVAINRAGYESCLMVSDTGLSTGSPSAYSVTPKLQHSADGSTNWTDFQAGTAIAADSTTTQTAIDLSLALAWVRVVHTVAFTGGTSPAVPNQATVILGGAKVLPAA